MKNTKIAASLLAVAMLAGVFAGCSKTSDITAEKFVKACGMLGLEEYEDYLDSMPGLSDAEDGVGISASYKNRKTACRNKRDDIRYV